MVTRRSKDVAQFHVRVCRRGMNLPAIKPRTAELGQPAEFTGRNGDGQAHLLLEVRVSLGAISVLAAFQCLGIRDVVPRK